MSEGDWSRYFSPVRAQLNCGSCWAQSTAAVIEAQYAIKNQRDPVALSVQQMVDCATGFCMGCNGGFPNLAMQYVQKNGLETEAAYPYASGYSGEATNCQFNPSVERVFIKGYDYCTNQYYWEQPKPCTPDIFDNLWRRGPVSVLIDANTQNFGSYYSGIYYPDSSICISRNHAVVLAGFGHDDQTGQQYAIIRNSWGANWGEAGYMRIRYDPNDYTNTCFTTESAWLPIL